MMVQDSDSVELAGTAANDVECGYIVERISATESWVQLVPTAAFN
jgi:hypothetical protein